MRHFGLLPTAIIGLLCAIWFVDHRFMAAKIGTTSAPIETIKTPVVAERTVDTDSGSRAAGPRPDLIAKTLNDVTGSIAAAPPKPTLHRMKNVAVKARPTSIDGALN